jgi:putative chitinase
MKLAAVQLEKVRALLNNPIHIDSWFRSEALNKAIGGVGKSAHMDGWAIDFVCSAFGDPKKIAQTISKSSIKFDQCILEGSWVHISFDPKMRGQVLSAHFTPGQSTTYSIGV